MFDKTVHDAFKSHAISVYPQEACGFVVGDEMDGAKIDDNFRAINCKFMNTQYIPCTNIAQIPETTFEIDPITYVTAQEQGTLLAVLHSHISVKREDGTYEEASDYPSALDMKSQQASDVPWGIGVCREDFCTDPAYFGDMLPIPNLIGRPFRHGVTDCFSLIRDCYRLGKEGMAEQGVPDWPYDPFTLEDMPRDFEWWKHGENHYIDNFVQRGFAVISQEEARVGDGFLMSIYSPVPNHGGIYLGDGLGLHHLQWQVSRRESLHLWQRKITHWLRYVGGADAA